MLFDWLNMELSGSAHLINVGLLSEKLLQEIIMPHLMIGTLLKEMIILLQVIATMLKEIVKIF